MPKIKINEHELYYKIYGEGEPVIFLNGIMMSTLSWKPFTESLKGYKLILLDLIDQGQSSKAEDYYDQEIHVDMIKEFMDKLSLEKVHLFGVSYGGEVAMRFALKYENRLNTLLLSNTTSKTTNMLKDIEKLWDFAASTYDGHVFFKATMPFIYSHKFYEENSKWLEDRENLFCKVFTKDWYEGFRRAARSASSLNLTDELHCISLPTLIIGSDMDIITPLAYQHILHEEIKHSHMVVIKDAGHASMYEKPYEFVSILKGFLDTAKYKILIP
ncbi:Pimeloyl-ACP methyl ester carboxylesterase [Clostridium amylolyticum]|uniref:Pimeloyl-ACP methyl ester carboxylesterase n=1 Tax=Clostridium amylolyticum TaxID=1121298 RepID=A0A1M6IKE4_9CLOT|nr:alpha/beta hydrolase [Clostridium amylolyticum]SHJ34884.1 Pimeloyl-ACP methyl ester carboxylesterase [Clostridium amylolyticum]